MPLFRRFGRPGLLGLAAGTAVVAGTATAVSGGMRRSQMRRDQTEYEAQQYEAAQAPPVQQATPTAAPDLMSEIERLSSLHDSGALTDAEFSAAKAKLLG
jgi:membrane protease subunit (stomatin/prohibitin family)